MVKDNHLRLEPDVNKILTSFQRQGFASTDVEIEVTEIEMLQAAIKAGGQWFLLDNMTPDMIDPLPNS